MPVGKQTNPPIWQLFYQRGKFTQTKSLRAEVTDMKGMLTLMSHVPAKISPSETGTFIFFQKTVNYAWEDRFFKGGHRFVTHAMFGDDNIKILYELIQRYLLFVYTANRNVVGGLVIKFGQNTETPPQTYICFEVWTSELSPDALFKMKKALNSFLGDDAGKFHLKPMRDEKFT